MLKAVIDTNVFVSSLLSKTGAPAGVIDAWRRGEFLLVVSPAVVEEIRRVLTSSRVRKEFSVQKADVAALVELLEKDALVVPGIADVTGAVHEDPADEKFLACACDGAADVIVSGDRRLLKLGVFRGISIVGTHEIEVCAHTALNQAPEACVFVPGPGGPYTIGSGDGLLGGNYYVFALIDLK